MKHLLMAKRVLKKKALVISPKEDMRTLKEAYI
jgi:hypothetical protein